MYVCVCACVCMCVCLYMRHIYKKYKYEKIFMFLDVIYILVFRDIGAEHLN